MGGWTMTTDGGDDAAVMDGQTIIDRLESSRYYYVETEGHRFLTLYNTALEVADGEYWLCFDAPQEIRKFAHEDLQPFTTKGPELRGSMTFIHIKTDGSDDPQVMLDKADRREVLGPCIGVDLHPNDDGQGVQMREGD